MELYLIRHGIATERGSHVDDDQRPLTPSGQRRTQQVAQRLRQLGLQFNLLQTSPLVRAQQTTEILRREGLAGRIAIASELSPEGSLAQWLNTVPTVDRLAIVGHQPDLGLWAEQLVWGSAQDKLLLKKAGIIGIVFAGDRPAIGSGSLFWLTPPRLLL